MRIPKRVGNAGIFYETDACRPNGCDDLRACVHLFARIGGAGAAVTAADAVLADIVQPTGTGYATADSQNTFAEAAGTATLTGTATVFTAGGTWQSFQNAVLFNQTAASDPLICYWAYASDLVLLTGETFTVKYDSSGTTGTIFTIA